MSNNKILERGNVAVAMAALDAGCRYYFGYPITPQGDIPEYLSREMPKLGGTFIQAESEIASINMLLGASASGARAMTSSSGPGISLKQEGISYLSGSELPAVIVNIARCGPGLGGISPTQGDYFQATRGGGHGDYRTLVFAPSTVQEMYDLTILAFEVADKYRNPVLILSDAVLGQMKEPFLRRASSGEERVKKPWAVTGKKGRPQNVIKSLYLKDGELEGHTLKLEEKYGRMRREETRYEKAWVDDASLVVIAFGICARIARTSVERIRDEGYRVGLLRPITLFPFPSSPIAEISKRVDHILVVELNTGQMIDDVRISVEGRAPIHFYGRPSGVGSLPSPEEIDEHIKGIINQGSGSRAQGPEVKKSEGRNDY